MDANRLDKIRTAAKLSPVGISSTAARSLFDHIDHQQSEIDRLTRAYEVLRKNMEFLSKKADSGADRSLAYAALIQSNILDGDSHE